MADAPAFVFTCVAFFIAGGSAIAVGRAKLGSPKYDGPYQGLTKNREWDYSDHGVSWAMGKCNSGIHQSPVELPTEIKNSSRSLFYRYKQIDKEMHMYNDGYMFSITADVCTGGFGIGESMTIDGQPLEVESKYALALVLFHSPSEHKWGGEHLPLEVQLVHRKSDDPESQAIISIGFNHAVDEVNEHPFLAALLEQDPTVEERTATDVNKLPEHSLDFGALIGDGNMWTYDGSMTVPSCKPNAKWFVRQHYHEAPAVQIEKFSTAIMQITNQNGNNRVTQPLGDRVVSLMKSVDATNIETVEEKEKRAEKTSAPATVAAPKDGDDEDAVQVASTVHVDPELDEGFRKQQEKLGTFFIKTSEQILSTFTRTAIVHYPEQIEDTDSGVVEARETVQKITDERDAAAQVMGSACDFTPETETKAKANSCNMAKQVSAEKEVELQAAQKILDERSVKVETEIRDAQADVQKAIQKEAEQTQAGGDEKTMQSVPSDTHQLQVAVPQGDVNDPFSMDCAESSSRIDAQNPGFAEYLTPNLDQSASVPGIHFTESDGGEADVMAPTDGEDDDDAPALFLQMHRGRQFRRYV